MLKMFFLNHFFKTCLLKKMVLKEMVQKKTTLLCPLHFPPLHQIGPLPAQPKPTERWRPGTKKKRSVPNVES